MKRRKQIDKVMKSTLKFFILCISSLLYNSSLIAQNNTNIDALFKMMLYIDMPNNNTTSLDKFIKGDSLYNIYKTVYDYKLDTLKVIKNVFIEDAPIHVTFDSFLFYKLEEKNILKIKETKSYDFPIGIPTHRDVNYIIGIDLKRGICYRLQGFVGNDFLVFLSDFKERYKTKTNKHITNTAFLKGFIVEDLNFRCLYKGLKAKELDTKKYPCLIKCSDLFSAHKSY